MKKRYLILEDGTMFQGWGFGAEQAATGELIFHTGVVGYVETLTDPCYCGQIVMQTFPMVGNYGIMEEDFEGTPQLSGYVVKEYCEVPSNFRCQYDLDTFLKNHNIPAICGVDTRELTNRIREYGVVNAMITDQLPEDFDEIASHTTEHAVARCTCSEIIVHDVPHAKAHVALIDCGVKNSLLRALTDLGCKVTQVPAQTSAADLLALQADGIVLSEGPGDPRENKALIETIAALVGQTPIFAVGLGHQLLALAMGGQVKKLKYGHHGGNQPCHKTGTRRTYITSQNHGYAVVTGSVDCAQESYVNLNDGSCEGLDYPDHRAFSVQFDPAACPDLFHRFLTMMKEG